MIANWLYDLFLTAVVLGVIAYAYRIGYEAGRCDGYSEARKWADR